MQVLLRDETGLFYAGRDFRTSDTRDAADFRDINLAAQLANDERLAGAEVVLNYFSPPCQLSLPVVQEWFPCARPVISVLLSAAVDPEEPVVPKSRTILVVEDLADDI